MKLLIGTYQDQTKEPLVGILKSKSRVTSKSYCKEKLTRGDVEAPFSSQSIKEIMNETGRDRATVSKYLRTLSKVGLIKEDKLGRQKMFWKPTLSDRQTGLELRGMGYKIQKMKEMLDDVQERNDQLIDETCDPSFSKRNRQTEESS